nr:hypothetical protein [Prevotella sp.]
MKKSQKRKAFTISSLFADGKDHAQFWFIFYFHRKAVFYCLKTGRYDAWA